MKHVLLGVLEKTIEFFPDQEVLKMLKTTPVSAEELPYYYEICRKASHVECASFLHEREELRENFLFLGDFYEKNLEKKNFKLLAYPRLIVTGRSFKKVLKDNYEDCTWTLKAMGQKTQEYGVTFLNNLDELFIMLKKPDHNLHFERFYNLDHTKELPKDLGQYSNFRILLDHYSEKRFFELLLNLEKDLRIDLRRILYTLNELSFDEQKEVLPKKPKTMKEVHDALSINLLRYQNKSPLPLKQEIMFLNGMSLKDYKIEIPETSVDLDRTSIELKHCVHSYVEDVRNGMCQILNLKKDGKRIYTVELKKRKGRYHVVQFKGVANGNVMEGTQGQEYVKELESLCLKGFKTC